MAAVIPALTPNLHVTFPTAGTEVGETGVRRQWTRTEREAFDAAIVTYGKCFSIVEKCVANAGLAALKRGEGNKDVVDRKDIVEYYYREKHQQNNLGWKVKPKQKVVQKRKRDAWRH